MTAAVGDGTGVAVTPLTNDPMVLPSAPATKLTPPAPTYSTSAATATTPIPRATRPTSGMPRLRLTGPRAERRPEAGERLDVLTGEERPPDGGRGRTWLGRVPRRVAIGPIVARPSV